MNSWIPVARYFFSYNGVSWSISTEMFFYLMFPLLVRDWHHTWKWKAPLVWCLVALLLSISTAAGFPDFDPRTPLAISSVGIAYIGPFARISEFVMGMVAAGFYLRNVDRGGHNVWVWTAIEIASICSIGFLWHHASSLPMLIAGHRLDTNAWVVFFGHSCAAPGFALLITAMAFGRGLCSKILSVRPMVLLGEASFALYLIHQILIGLIRVHRDDWLRDYSDAQLYVAYWVVALACAFALWRFIEMPARDMVKKISIRQWTAAKA
ncbi:acyltransferase family protein [Paraburkholderia acidisoli]|uniref:Acyltransferase family protein n=1 Tax=Paraburkholderia acidisoli TaxID=2571748 RepID=A0A7Z2GQY8_9BURK|nr:acyltransferase [Paraburkholderia acidisoli]QGZ66255.1 acyltransferase family protein [Paraburkholderia acidisoli]